MSLTAILKRLTLPLFSIVIKYLTISPIPRDPSPFSCTVTVLVTSRSGIGEILTTVGSSAAAVLVSSEISVTSFVSPGLLAVTRALLIILPVLAAATEIVYLAVYTAFSPLELIVPHQILEKNLGN